MFTCAHRPMMRSMGLFELSARAIRSLHKLLPMSGERKKTIREIKIAMRDGN